MFEPENVSRFTRDKTVKNPSCPFVYFTHKFINSDNSLKSDSKLVSSAMKKSLEKQTVTGAPE